MDHSELGEPFQNFHFKFVEPHEHEAVLKMLEKYLYVCMEPLGYKEEMAEDWNSYFTAMMKKGHNLSYIAVDTETGEIAAARMVDLARKGDPEEVPSSFKHQPVIDSVQLCIELCKDWNLFEKYNITEYADMFGLCVSDKYRQRGLATQMYTRGLNFLKNRGFQIVKCGFVSPFTRRAGYQHGYIQLSKRRFLDCYDSQGKVFNPKTDPEGFICMGIFDLRDESSRNEG